MDSGLFVMGSRGLSPASRRHRTGASTGRCGCERATTAGEGGRWSEQVNVAHERGQLSNPKLQIPNPNDSQLPSPKRSKCPSSTANLGSWQLGVPLELGMVGAWDLELGIYPVFLIPAATPLIVTSRARRSSTTSSDSSVSAVRQAHGAQPAQQLDLDDVDRVDIGVADVDRPAQHRVLFEQERVWPVISSTAFAARVSRARSSRPSVVKVVSTTRYRS